MPASTFLLTRSQSTLNATPAKLKLKTMKFTQIMLATAIIAVMPFEGNWKPDAANAKISFSVKGPFGTVHGSFSELKATIEFDEKSPAKGSITASVEAKTVSTGVGLRNHDLRTEEQWLDTDKYPQIKFQSKKIEKTDKGYKAIGDLTLKGTTKPVEIPFTFSPKGDEGVFKGQFVIKRGDYKVGKTGGSVGNDVTITLEIPVKK
jgi:polyisoprenoid-binding protein YceI